MFEKGLLLSIAWEARLLFEMGMIVKTRKVRLNANAGLNVKFGQAKVGPDVVFGQAKVGLKAN